MRTTTLIQGEEYKATFRLNFIHALAENDQVAARLTELGFSDVSVTGGGYVRHAKGKWTRSTQEITLPSEVEQFYKSVKSLL